MIKVIDNLEIRGNGHYKELFYAPSEDRVTEGPAFIYKGQCYFLDEFVKIVEEGTSSFTLKHKKLSQLFDGIMTLNLFSGLLVKLTPSNHAIQVYEYYLMDRSEKLET